MEEKTKLVEKRQAKKKIKLRSISLMRLRLSTAEARQNCLLPAACRRPAGQSAVSDPLALAVCAAQAAAIWRNFKV